MAPLYIRSAGRVATAVARAQPAKTRASALPYGLPPPPAGWVQREAGISLCMIVKDEERFLDACLRSVAGFVDEICIVDTGSTDRTVEIALAFGARVEHRSWRNDFAWARNEALAMATKRWIFVLDADEELDAASAELFAMLRTVPAHLTGIWVRCNNLSDDYKGTGVSSHALVRMFPNNERIRYLSPVHEFISLDAKTTGIEARMGQLSITHHGYLSEIVEARNKSQRNLLLVQAATKANPGEPFNWYNLGTTSLLCGDRVGAVAALEKMREIVGESQRGFVPNALAQLADLHTDNGEFERAIEMANESLRKAPHFANAHFALGRALIKLQRFAEGRAAFDAAIGDAAHSARQFIVDDEVSAWKAHCEIGTSYGLEGNDLAALAWFDRALVNRPRVVPVRLNRAKALERLERYPEAETMYRELAADEPGDAHSVDYVNYLLRRNHLVRAMQTIEEVLDATTPRTQASLLVIAAKLVGPTGLGDVETLLVRAVAAYPGAADALEALESFYTERGRADEIASLRAGSLDAPLALPTDHARRGSMLLAAGQLGEAEAVTRAGLRLAPADPGLHYNLGAVLVQTGRKEEALHELDKAGDLGEIGLRAAFLQSIIFGDLGRFEDAIVAIDRVIAQAPTEVDARLQRFRFVEALGHRPEAERTLRAALDLGDARIATELATWLLRQGRFADAAEVADRALAVV